VAVGELDAFVIEQMRALGKDPRLVREAVKDAQRIARDRSPEIQKELRKFERERQRLDAEKMNLVDFVAGGSDGAPSLLARVAQIEVEIQLQAPRVAECQAELAALEAGAIDESDLLRALLDLDSLWDEIAPEEKAHRIGLLIEGVTYDSAIGEVGVTFRPGGVRVLAECEEKKIA